MTTAAYIFLAQQKEQRIPFHLQQEQIDAFAREMNLAIDELFVENDSPLSLSFAERKEGGKIMEGVRSNDTIICLKMEWILSTTLQAGKLLEELRQRGVSLLCVDVKEDLSMDKERKLVVSTGNAQLIQKLIEALGICEEENVENRIAEAPVEKQQVEERHNRFAGGPIPFGFRVHDDGYLIEDETEQQIIAEMVEMRQRRISYRKMSALLKEKHQVRLSNEGIRKILKRLK